MQAFTPSTIKIIERQLLHGDKTKLAKLCDTTKQTVDAAFRAEGITPKFREIYLAASQIIADRKAQDRKALTKLETQSK